MSPELDAKRLNYFQENMGRPRWAIELGQVNTATEVALLSRHLALPRRGHIGQCFNIYTNLKKHQYFKLVMNPSYINVQDHYPYSFNYKAEWFKFYGDIKEDIPKNIPRALGKGV